MFDFFIINIWEKNEKFSSQNLGDSSPKSSSHHPNSKDTLTAKKPEKGRGRVPEKQKKKK
jgi:hypothetical protein